MDAEIGRRFDDLTSLAKRPQDHVVTPEDGGVFKLPLVRISERLGGGLS
jgi:hypothetical protein